MWILDTVLCHGKNNGRPTVTAGMILCNHVWRTSSRGRPTAGPVRQTPRRTNDLSGRRRLVGGFYRWRTAVPRRLAALRAICNEFLPRPVAARPWTVARSRPRGTCQSAERKEKNKKKIERTEHKNAYYDIAICYCNGEKLSVCLAKIINLEYYTQYVVTTTIIFIHRRYRRSVYYNKTLPSGVLVLKRVCGWVCPLCMCACVCVVFYSVFALVIV